MNARCGPSNTKGVPNGVEELSRAESATNAWPEDAPPPMEIDESNVTEESDASDIVVRTVDEAGRDEMPWAIHTRWLFQRTISVGHRNDV